MTDKQINLAIGAIINAELVMDFPDVILDALNSVIAFLATMDEQPERKKGKWIVTSEFSDCYYAQCNQCNVTQIFYYGKPLTNYCPNCGADMREGEKE